MASLVSDSKPNTGLANSLSNVFKLVSLPLSYVGMMGSFTSTLEKYS